MGIGCVAYVAVFVVSLLILGFATLAFFAYVGYEVLWLLRPR
jgi:hypothetical protein